MDLQSVQFKDLTCKPEVLAILVVKYELVPCGIGRVGTSKFLSEISASFADRFIKS